MLVDTHCHINIMVQEGFDKLLTAEELARAGDIISLAKKNDVKIIINVGTSIIESNNCIKLAQKYPEIFATVGIHPNDLTSSYKEDIEQLKKWLKQKDANRIVGIGETGLDRHYPDYNIKMQKDAFKAQIDLSLEYNVGLVVHTRDARDETLYSLEEYKGQIKKGIIHCFSEDQSFADTVIEWGFKIGIGGTITYPKNEYLRDVVRNVSLEDIVLETDAPFLPPQIIRGKKNYPQYIQTIAHYIAELKEQSYESVAEVTTKNAIAIFNFES